MADEKKSRLPWGMSEAELKPNSVQVYINLFISYAFHCAECISLQRVYESINAEDLEA